MATAAHEAVGLYRQLHTGGASGDTNGGVRPARTKITARKSTNSSLYRTFEPKNPIPVEFLRDVQHGLEAKESLGSVSKVSDKTEEIVSSAAGDSSLTTTIQSRAAKFDTTIENSTSSRTDYDRSVPNRAPQDNCKSPYIRFTQMRSLFGIKMPKQLTKPDSLVCQQPNRTYARVNGQVSTGARVLRSLKPERALIKERLERPRLPLPPSNNDNINFDRSLSESTDNGQPSGVLSAPPPPPAPDCSFESPLKVKRNVDESLQTIPANMANLRTVPLVVLKPMAQLRALLLNSPTRRKERNVDSRRRERVTRPGNPLRRVKTASRVHVHDEGRDKGPSTSGECIGVRYPPRTASSPKRSGQNDGHFFGKYSYVVCKQIDNSSEPRRRYNAATGFKKRGRPLGSRKVKKVFCGYSPKRTGRNDGHFFGKYAYMVGKRIDDPVEARPRHPTVGHRKRGRPIGSTKKRVPYPEIDVIDGLEFLSFESEEDLERFMRNNPGRVCKGPPPPPPRKPIDFEESPRRSVPGQPIIPTKTHDITKIKGWRNKVFDPQAISTLDLLLKNFGRQEFRNVCYEKPLVSLPGYGARSSTSIGVADNYVDHADQYTSYDDMIEVDVGDIDWSVDYDGCSGRNEEDGDFNSNNDTESIKSIDLGILSSDCIDEELQKSHSDRYDVDCAPSLPIGNVQDKVVTTPSVKSAFVSEYLDDFLKNQAKLKVKLPEPVYVSPDDIDTKVVWPSHEMAVLDQVPPIPDLPRTVQQSAFRQRRVTRPGDSTRCRPRKCFGRGRLLRNQCKAPSELLRTPLVIPTGISTSENWQHQMPLDFAELSMADALFAASALVSQYVWNKGTAMLATGKQINRILNQPFFESANFVKARKMKAEEFSVPVLHFQAELAASAVVVPSVPAMKKVKERNSDVVLDAWERFLKATSTNRKTGRHSSSDVSFNSHDRRTSHSDSASTADDSVVSTEPAGLVRCEKEFCQLGCVCDSLKVRKRRRQHCGKVQCMFSCSCNISFQGTKTASEKAIAGEGDDARLPKRRRQIRIPARLKDSVYFYGGDGVQKNNSKAAESTKEEKYNKYKMKTKHKPHNKTSKTNEAHFVDQPPRIPIRSLQHKLAAGDFGATLARLSTSELAAYSKLGGMDVEPTTVHRYFGDQAPTFGYSAPTKSLLKKRGGISVANTATANRPQLSFAPSPVKPGRLEFTFKPIAPIIRPASSRSIPTILRRSGNQTARKSLNPTSLYQAVPVHEQADESKIGFRRVVESNDRVESVVKNLLEEMIRKVVFRQEIGGSLYDQITHRAKMGCVQTVSTQASSPSFSEPVGVRFPWSKSRENMDRRQMNEAVGAISELSAASTEKVKLTRQEREQNRRKALRLAFTHLAMVSCPVVKDMWSQRNQSLSITAFVFRMACTAIGRLRQQEKKLLLAKQSLIRERMELFNKYTEYLKGVDPNKRKLAIKELAKNLQDCCRERNQRNKNSEEQQVVTNSAMATNMQRKNNESVKEFISVGDVSDGLSRTSDDEVTIIEPATPTASHSASISGKDSILNATLSVGNTIGKVANKLISLGDSVLISGSFASSMRPIGIDDFKDSDSVKTIRLQRPYGGTKWIPLEGDSDDSMTERNDVMEKRDAVVPPIGKPPAVVGRVMTSNTVTCCAVRWPKVGPEWVTLKGDAKESKELNGNKEPNNTVKAPIRMPPPPAAIVGRVAPANTVSSSTVKVPQRGCTVAELLQRAKQQVVITAPTCSSSNLTTSNAIGIPGINKRVVSSLPQTMTFLKTTANGPSLAMSSDKSLVLNVVPTTLGTSNGTISARSSSVRLMPKSAVESTTVLANQSSTTPAVSIAVKAPNPDDGSRFVVIKPKPYPIVRDSLPTLEELRAFSPVGDKPLNIEDVVKHKRGSVATLLKQQRDAVRAAAVAAEVSHQPRPVLVPMRSTFPRSIVPINAFVPTPIAVSAGVSIGVDGMNSVQLPSSEMPKIVAFSSISENEFLCEEDNVGEEPVS